jgi:hypothetical protein
VVTHNRPPNGQDCGPTACFLLKHLMDTGLMDDNGDIHIPPIPCGHDLRLQMLGTIREACRTSWQDYIVLTSSDPSQDDLWTTWNDTSFVDDEGLAAMENEESGEQYSPVVQKLNITSANYAACQRSRRAAQADRERDDDGPPEIHANDEPFIEVDEGNIAIPTKAKRLRELFKLHPDIKRARCRDLLPSRPVKGMVSEEDQNQRKHVKDKAQCVASPDRPTPPIALPAYTGRGWLPFNQGFDNYEGAPVYESMHPHHNPYEFMVEPYYRQGIWSMFRDYGWRLQPNFYQMFYLEDPIHVLDHVLVVGVANDYDPSQQVSDHVTDKGVCLYQPLIVL